LILVCKGKDGQYFINCHLVEAATNISNRQHELGVRLVRLYLELDEFHNGTEAVSDQI